MTATIDGQPGPATPLDAWRDALLRALPPVLRPAPSPRMGHATEAAWRAGWAAADLAAELAALDLHLRLDQPHSVIPDEITRIGALPPPDGYAPPDMAPVRPPTYRPLMARPDEHCGRVACRCEHRECYRGWLDRDASSTCPCAVCRPELFGVLRVVAPPGQRGPADQGAIQTRHKDDREGW